MTPMAWMVHDSLVNDQAGFRTKYPEYTADKITAFANEITSVENRTRLPELLALLKTKTAELVALQESLRPVMTTLDRYVMKAKDLLSIAPGDFGIKEVREEISRGDTEKLIDTLEVVKHHVTNEYENLQTKGYTEADRTLLLTTLEQVKTANREQNELTDQKEAVIQANGGIIEALLVTAREVMKDGKSLYKYSNPEKAGNYTEQVLLRRMRHEYERKNEEEPPQ